MIEHGAIAAVYAMRGRPGVLVDGTIEFAVESLERRGPGLISGVDELLAKVDEIDAGGDPDAYLRAAAIEHGDDTDAYERAINRLYIGG